MLSFGLVLGEGSAVLDTQFGCLGDHPGECSIVVQAGDMPVPGSEYNLLGPLAPNSPA